MEKDIKTGTTPSKKKARWSKSIELNGIYKSLSVKEVENGFVIEQTMYGSDTTKKDSKYIDKCTTYISKTNPLEGKEADKDEDNDPFTLKGLDVLIID